MRKFNVLLSMILMLALLLTACGGEETSTSIPSTDVPPVTAEATATDDMGATGTPEGDTTTTPGVPVTGADSPSRATVMMDLNVWNQNGEQVGEVDDLVLDLDNTRVSYVVVGTGGFLDLGERTVLIPWDSLQLQTGAGDNTGGEQNAFILVADPEFLQNAPDVDLNTVLPGMSQPAGDWDADIRNFWSTGQVPGGTGTGTEAATTPSADGTAVPEGTATSDTGGTGTTTGTATANTGTGSTGSGTGTQGSGDQLQGVMLASEVIGSTITIGNGEGAGTDTVGTAMPDVTATATTDGTGSTGTTTGTATATTGIGDTTSTATATTGTGGTGAGTLEGDSATIEDLIIDTATGDIEYLVLNTDFTEGERWIPVPLSLLRWDAAANGFLFVANANALQNAPFFQPDQFPDTSSDGWDSDFSTFWQNNGGTGGTSSGGVIASTATSTP